MTPASAPRRIFPSLAAAVWLLSSEVGSAQPAAAPASAIGDGKTTLSDGDVARKKEGSYFAPLVLASSDPDKGIGLGGRVYWYSDGKRTDPFFRYTPYRHAISAQAFATTNGYENYFLDYDAPYLADSAFRVRATASYEKNIAANYFGQGRGAMGNLGFPASARSFTRYDPYYAALRQLRPGGLAYTLYNKYWVDDPQVRATLERDLLAGRVRVQAGLIASYVRVRDYSGTITQGDDPAAGLANMAARMGTTRLQEDCAAGRIVGCGGGVNNLLKIGVAFDTRDYEPDPNAGVFVDVTAEVSSRVFGSSFDYARVTFAPRVFVSPVPSITDAVIAVRAVYSVQTQGTPFFAADTLAFTDGDRYGLGGLTTLRGYKQDRFVGAVTAMVNLEVRCTLFDFDLLAQNVGVAVVPFVDAGRVFDRVGDFSLAGWRRGGGVGLHLAWNKGTIITVDYGLSTEDSGLYFGFGEQF